MILNIENYYLNNITKSSFNIYKTSVAVSAFENECFWKQIGNAMNIRRNKD